SGNDGTSWAAVEGKLSPDSTLGELFTDFGLPTAWILEQLAAHPPRRAQVIASGGIRNGIQAVKALALGARYVSVARPFLLAAQESAEAVERLARSLMEQMRVAMFLVGARSLDDLGPAMLMRLG
ncbi:MAG TPA: alpha-hydroxy-acid oxidizing protein, partial [bacterium]|nr:alpha-hydroxy-acid oxidizing protein [bacterium]